MKLRSVKMMALSSAIALSASASLAQAATWSDTFIGYRYGTQFTEPTNDQKVKKHVLQLTHVSGYSIGQNFLNIDVLQSDKKDPTRADGDNGATEAYLTYRHQLHLGKVLDKDLSFGPVKDIGLTAGFDLNTKNNTFASRKRLLVVGPTLRFDVPKGFVDLSLLYGKEWNHCGLGAPACEKSRITFDSQFIASLAWGIPFDAGAVPLKFQGFANWVGPKGKDYVGVKTKAEILVRTSLMADVGKLAFDKKDTLWVGVGYEFWNNKFGNRYYGDGTKKAGIRTNAPTLQVEWHF
ncbi:hypothetical protein L1889_11585 [Paenalcaligenes niemegkensis]|uniref:hypothetical protein n=1 Tax=Paenalcaligenes niemegkensis TaxID=2895469 RepID=UPI001EE93A41|nr:hypothetical protein [Paenalcaligenes niemegkensis]MCQ9617251.1 hypothetical protein [Paenalcaligenes niemegkensis]